MNPDKVKKISKFLSLVLRHQPQLIGLKLDEGGWAEVEELMTKSRSRQKDLDLETLKFVVDNNNKQRFSFSSDNKRIRANQGHSLEVDLGLVAQKPPEVLFHGTATRNIDSIKEKGLVKGKRQHVHLSTNEETARDVGKRYGVPGVLRVRAGQMHRDGIAFYLSENGVWLAESVPAVYFDFE